MPYGPAYTLTSGALLADGEALEARRAQLETGSAVIDAYLVTNTADFDQTVTFQYVLPEGAEVPAVTVDGEPIEIADGDVTFTLDLSAGQTVALQFTDPAE